MIKRFTLIVLSWFVIMAGMSVVFAAEAGPVTNLDEIRETKPSQPKQTSWYVNCDDESVYGLCSHDTAWSEYDNPNDDTDDYRAYGTAWYSYAEDDECFFSESDECNPFV